MIKEDKQTISIRGNEYQFISSGQGYPCLAIGNGLLVHRTLSTQFKDKFKLYASDLYWGYNQRLDDPTAITFEQIIEDIVEVINQLHIEKPIIFGFSAFGLVALELAKRHPDLISAVIMVGTPLNSNLEVAQQNQKIFEETADEHRKEIDAYRRAIVAKEDLSHLTFPERFNREYIYRDAPRYWHNPEFDCSELWEGIELDKILEHFFTSIIPYIDVTEGIEKIAMPVYLAAGLSDYDCCPAQSWGSTDKLPQNFTLEIYTQSGHYPQLEERDLFDKRLTKWLMHNLQN